MEIAPIAYNGILQPSDLDVLHRVVARLCAARNVRPESDEALDTAIRVLYFHEQGITDEDALLAAAMGRLQDHLANARAREARPLGRANHAGVSDIAQAPALL